MSSKVPSLMAAFLSLQSSVHTLPATPLSRRFSLSSSNTCVVARRLCHAPDAVEAQLDSIMPLADRFPLCNDARIRSEMLQQVPTINIHKTAFHQSILEHA